MRKLFIGGLLAIPVLGFLKKRAIVKHLSGKTEDEVRAAVEAKLADRAPAEKRSEIADRIVSRLRSRGMLADA